MRTSSSGDNVDSSIHLDGGGHGDHLAHPASMDDENVLILSSP